MAQKVEVLLVDDIDGGPADETITFSLDGTPYEIDLNSEHADKLRTGLEPFIAKARRSRTSNKAPRTRTTSNRERSAEIREWAKQNGIKVNERGRIPAAVIEKYEAAH